MNDAQYVDLNGESFEIDPRRIIEGAALDAVSANPYVDRQWYLAGRDLQASGSAGINVDPIRSEVTGRGVRVGVVDSGFDIDHRDLAQRFDLSASIDPRDARTATSIRPDDKGMEQHGTWVSGVIGADARNAWGIAGIAYDATLVGSYIRFGQSSSSRSEVASLLARQIGVDVSNSSWGYHTAFADNFRSDAWSGIQSAIEGAAESGRGGLGTVWVFAAGNDRQYVAGNSAYDGDNTNYHSLTNARQIVTVAASDANGAVASFSTPGASVLVAAPGTSIYTTSVTTGADQSNAFSYVSGTSIAAPIVSSVVALMLEANPELGYRDVQDILAISSTRTGASASWGVNAARTWNGGGFQVNDDLGFGIVDARAAVRLAETWQDRRTAANEEAIEVTGRIDDTDLLREGGRNTYTTHVSEDLALEWVEVDLDIAHSHIGDLKVILRSPGGTESVLVDRPAAGTNDADGLRFTLTSAHFRGEGVAGQWSLRVEDAGSSSSGRVEGYSLRFYGVQASLDQTYYYTDAFFTLGAGRSVLNDASGHNAINAAAIAQDSTIDLSGAGPSTLGTKPLTITHPGAVADAISGDGHDRLVGNDGTNHLIAGRGNDTLVGGRGDDRLDGGLGLDTVVYTGGRYGTTISGSRSEGQIVSGASIGRDQLKDIEIIRFSDGRMVYDVSDPFAVAYRMYDTAFDRQPDMAGLNFWASAIGDGMPLDVMASGFSNSPEFLSTYGFLSNRGFVEQLYRNVLDREGDADGIAYWTAQLEANAITRGRALVGFSESAEHIEKLRAPIEAGLWDLNEVAAASARLYHAALDRAPDAAGLSGWTQAIENGRALADVADSFAFSAEFQAKYGTLSNEDYVRQLYRNVLDREADAGGLASWLGELSSGRFDRGDVLLGFSDSSEFQLKMQSIIDSGILMA